MDRFLAPELTEQILSRLPVVARARFRCVCKSWFTIISLLPLKRTPIFLVCSYVQRYGGIDRTIWIVRFSSYDMQGNLLKEFHHNFENEITLKAGFTCLDFVCFDVRRSNMFMCNPTTKEVIALPKISSYYNEIKFIGFGCVLSSKEFKCLCLHQYGNRDHYRWKVLTVGNEDCWREVENPPFPALLYPDAAFAMGAIHLLPDMLPDGYKIFEENHEIAFFDLEREEWGRVAVPSLYYYNDVALGELRGYLCMVISDWEKGDEISIWLLKNMEWVEEYNFAFPMDTKYGSLQTILCSLTTDEDGNLLMLLQIFEDGEDSVFRVTCNSRQVIEVKLLTKGQICGTSLYLESYLPLKKK